MKLCLTGIFFPIEMCAEACFVHLDPDFTEASYVFVISGRFLQMITNLLCSTTLKLQGISYFKLIEVSKKGAGNNNICFVCEVRIPFDSCFMLS